MLSPNPDKPGLIERLLRASGREAGVNLQVMYAPIPRCLALLARGETDATIAAPTQRNWPMARFPLEARKVGDGPPTPASVDRQRRLVRLHLMVIKRRNDVWTWDGERFGPDPARPPLVGVRRHLTAAVEALEAVGAQPDDSPLSLRQLLGMLRLKRFDAGVAVASELRQELRRGDWQDIETLPTPLLQVDYFVAVSLRHWERDPARVEAWWSAMGRLRAVAPYKFR